MDKQRKEKRKKKKNSKKILTKLQTSSKWCFSSKTPTTPFS